PQTHQQIQITKKRSSNAAAHLDAQQKSLAECSRLPHDFLYARAERFRRLCRDHRLELRCILRCVATIRFLLPQILERLSLPDVSNRQSSSSPLELPPTDHSRTGSGLGVQHASRSRSDCPAVRSLPAGRLFSERRR